MGDNFFTKHMDKFIWFMVGWAISVMFYKMI